MKAGLAALAVLAELAGRCVLIRQYPLKKPCFLVKS